MDCLKPFVQTLCAPWARRWGYITKAEYDAEVTQLKREEKYSAFLRKHWKKQLDQLKIKITAGQDGQGNQDTVGKGQDGTNDDRHELTSATTGTS